MHPFAYSYAMPTYQPMAMTLPPAHDADTHPFWGAGTAMIDNAKAGINEKETVLHMDVIDDEADSLVGTQEKTMWCWAATIQLILAYHGIEQSQSDLVKRVKGSDVNQSIGNTRMPSLINGTYETLDGDDVNLSAKGHYPHELTDDAIVNEVQAGRPMIIGLKGRQRSNLNHAVILRGVAVDNETEKPTRIILFDPMDKFGTDGTERTIAWDEFRSRLDYSITIEKEYV